MIDACVALFLSHYGIFGPACYAFQFCLLDGILKRTSPKARAIVVTVIKHVLIEVPNYNQTNFGVAGLDLNPVRLLCGESRLKCRFPNHRGAAFVAVPGKNSSVNIPICGAHKRKPSTSRTLWVSGVER